MKLRVIEGGLGAAAEEDMRPEDGRAPTAEDVRREATRRLGESGYHLSRVREFASGVQMPQTLRHLRLQLDFTAETLSRLDPIPADFRSDGYWPTR